MLRLLSDCFRARRHPPRRVPFPQAPPPPRLVPHQWRAPVCSGRVLLVRSCLFRARGSWRSGGRRAPSGAHCFRGEGHRASAPASWFGGPRGHGALHRAVLSPARYRHLRHRSVPEV